MINPFIDACLLLAPMMQSREKEPNICRNHWDAARIEITHCTPPPPTRFLSPLDMSAGFSIIPVSDCHLFSAGRRRDWRRNRFLKRLLPLRN